MTTTPVPSVVLLARIAATTADEADWQELIQRHGEAMRRAAALGTGGEGVIDDAVQETLLHLRRCAGRFQPRGGDGETEVRRWLQRLTVNCAISLQRAELRRHHREAIHAEMTMRPDRHDDDTAPRSDQMARAMAHLGQDERQVLLLRHVDGLDHHGLANALGTSEATARKRLSRAHERLRTCLLRAGCALTLPALGTHLSAATGTALAPAPAAAWVHAALAGTAPTLPLHLVVGGSSVAGMTAVVAVPLLAAALAVGTVALRAQAPSEPPKPAPAAVPTPVAASTWKPQNAGAYQWHDAANWSTGIPDGPGAAATVDLGRQGRMSITLARPVTLGRLALGETAGKADFAAVTIAGDQPLTFAGEKPGAPTVFTITQGAVPNGVRLDLAAGIRLGGSSPLTVTIDSPSVFDCAVRRIDLGDTFFTLDGARRFNPGDGWKGVAWSVGEIAGSGTYRQNGPGTSTAGANRDFTGTLVVTNGDFTAEHLPAVQRYEVAGAFMPKHKYPRGGTLTLRNGTPLMPGQAIPTRFNPQATIDLPGGGYVVYTGETFDEQAFVGQPRPAVVMRVRQIRFLGGMSELKVGNGNDVSSSTTLLASDPREALVRRPGATVMVGGGDITSKQGYEGSYGRNERLDFASGMATQLKGAGGAPGSQTRSIIPWMTIGTLYHPGDGGFATWDSGTGVHTLRKEEYASTINGPPGRNVRCDNLNLGANQRQEVTSLFYGGWGNSDIGAGSTIVITSGGLRTGSMGGCTIGKTPGAAGTIDFGAAEGVIWTAWVTPYGDTTIHSLITGSGGVTKASTSTLILTATNAWSGGTWVSSGTLQVGDGKSPAAHLGSGDVEIASGATLAVATGVTDAVNDRATLILHRTCAEFRSAVDLAEGVDEAVAALVVDGKPQPAGRYGGADSSATIKLPDHFTGKGVLTVRGTVGGAK